MMTPAPRNLAASVAARLRERSRELGEDHQYVLMRDQAVEEIREFLEMPMMAAMRGERLKAAWRKGGPWKRTG